MTDQPKVLLAQLEEQCTIAAPVIRRRQQSRDVRSSIFCSWPTATASRLCSCATKYAILSVCPPRWAARWAAGSRASTQAGACATVTAGEIAAEIYTAQKDTGERVSHIVLMGIGEPLHNF